MNKRLLKYIIPLLLLSTSVSLKGQEVINQEVIDLCSNRNQVFESGEKLVYSIYYNWNFVWIPAGTVEFSIVENENNFEITAIGRTYEEYNWFFQVEDYYFSSIDKNNLLPNYYKRDILEGNYAVVNEIEFDYKQEMVHSSLKVNNKSFENFTFELKTCIHDLLSLVYNLRNIDIEVLRNEENIEVDLIFDEKVFHLPIRYLGEENNKNIRNLGYFDVLMISPDLIIGNVFKQDSEMIMWVSNDSNRVPLLIESPIKMGTVKAVLKSWENLKTPWEIKK